LYVLLEAHLIYVLERQDFNFTHLDQQLPRLGVKKVGLLEPNLKKTFIKPDITGYTEDIVSTYAQFVTMNHKNVWSVDQSQKQNGMD
jgi:hypothetical protein